MPTCVVTTLLLTGRGPILYAISVVLVGRFKNMSLCPLNGLTEGATASIFDVKPAGKRW